MFTIIKLIYLKYKKQDWIDNLVELSYIIVTDGLIIWLLSIFY
jgi:hypothetical protein